ncbi:hypothetical protein D5400_11780 [Georhizobium profundi]|uniref:Holin of 3TMs, for gene-transfer release n=1 Tax=Georhizobium profundi TaxID=2341112 RepID=A0A3S9B4H9_9HYPH|nr:hypothetical protein [Georhizobium profundi]AZN71868.1 hypothetical protein D5400_11780 [Georhizobium profundi]
MSAIGSILAGVAVKVGAPIIKEILADRFGRGGDIAGDVIDTIAGKVGVPVDELATVPSSQLEVAVAQAEAEHGPEWLQLWTAGLAYQQAVLQADQGEPLVARAWRWGWMYLLGFLWTWTLVLVPTVNAMLSADIQPPERSDLLTLTTWFLALYMGGHTVKDLGHAAKEAWQARKIP